MHEKSFRWITDMLRLPIPLNHISRKNTNAFFKKLGLTPRKAEEPLRGMALQEKDKKDEKDIRKL